MRQHVTFMCGLGLLAVLVLAVAPASAATITWGSATTVSGDSDVSTNGTLVGAYNYDSAGNTYTVNGVAFADWATTSTSKTGVGGVDFVWNFNLPHYDFSSTANPYLSLDAATKNLLKTAVSATGATSTLTITDLTVGQEYEIQMWAQDPRQSSPNVTLTAGNAVTLDVNSTNAAGGVGQYAIGTFTATATTQTVDMTASGYYATNALQLRAVPEPATMALLAIGGLGLLARRRRK